MISGCKFLYRSMVAVVLLLAGSIGYAPAAERPELLVAISLDMPPYVMDDAASGLEVDIVRQALMGYRLHFIQLPYGELQTAVQQRGVDVSLGVQQEDNDLLSSTDFVTFANYAISKKADGFRIDSVADLRDRQVLTWGNAYRELGGEFEAMFSPQSSQRKNYIEVADQEEQVRMFWEGKGLVVVIDHSIFSHFSRKMNHPLDQVAFHAIFPPVTNFKAAFKDVAVRNRFDEGIAALCGSGEYAELLQRYGVVVKQSVCE